MMKRCKIDGCTGDLVAHELCSKHYQAAKKAGDLPVRLSVGERINKYSRLDPNTGCIEWVRSKDSSGYGHIVVNGKLTRVHRVAWELKNGPIPDGLQVLHKCDNRICRNEDHLFLGTHAVNMADMKTKGRQVSFEGERHWHAKLTEEDIKKIRFDPRPQREIAGDYGVVRSLVGMIKRRVVWSHVA